jgi:hypothetical protein
MAATMGARVLIGATLLWLGAAHVLAQASIPAELRGDWVPVSAECSSKVRLRVAESTLTLVNGADSQTWGDVALPASYFGPDYTGISVVALPDFEGSQPFTVFFNADDKKGVTTVNIYNEMGGPMNPQLAAIQAAAKKLATRFPLNDAPLKRCSGTAGARQ